MNITKDVLFCEMGESYTCEKSIFIGAALGFLGKNKERKRSKCSKAIPFTQDPILSKKPTIWRSYCCLPSPEFSCFVPTPT